jgi:hypothetical protein
MPVVAEYSTSIWNTKMARALVGEGSIENEPDCYRGLWVDVCTPALEPIREGVVEVALIPLDTT